MFATLGMILTFGGSALAMVALARLRRAGCPGCGATGSLALLAASADEPLGGWATITRTFRCAACGAAVREHQPVSSPHDRPRPRRIGQQPRRRGPAVLPPPRPAPVVPTD